MHGEINLLYNHAILLSNAGMWHWGLPENTFRHNRRALLEWTGGGGGDMDGDVL